MMEALRFRHEFKFLCSEAALQLMENRVKHICPLDPHVKGRGTYVIRSLYFDTYDDSCLQENEMGVDSRKKYRLRVYNGDTDVIKLECKHSRHGMKAKEICRVTKEQCEDLIIGKPVGNIKPDQKLLERFVWEKSINLLAPKVIVEYTRTPYIYPVENTRITFDRHICSSVDVAVFLDKTIVRRSILPNNVNLLEVKYDKVLPAAVLDCLTGGQQLQKTSFSKYALCRKYSL